MKTLLTFLLLTLTLTANTHPFKKEISFNEISAPTLVKVELDNAIYAHSSHNYSDLRVASTQGVEGYFIQSQTAPKAVTTSQRLTATHYNREKATLLYTFAQPFDVEKIILNIEDRNFESTFDVYVDGALVVKEVKIFDYSRETGNQNFTITLPKVKAKRLKIVYHLDQTTSFYKKYRDIEQLTHYLTIKSIRCLNHNQRAKRTLKSTTIPLASSTLKEGKSSYIFKTNSIPFSQLTIKTLEKNFNRNAHLYTSDDNQTWHSLTHFSLFASTFNHQQQTSVTVTGRAKYLKVEIKNGDNQPLTLLSISLESLPKNLYFIAQPSESYTLYFGDTKLPKPHYELAQLVDENTPYVQGVFKKIKKLEVEKESIPKVSFFEQHKKSLFMAVILLTLGVMGYIAFVLLGKRSREV